MPGEFKSMGRRQIFPSVSMSFLNSELMTETQNEREREREAGGNGQTCHKALPGESREAVEV